MKQKNNKLVVIATIFCILIVGIIGVLWVGELNERQSSNDRASKKIDNKNDEETTSLIETQEIQGDFEIETPYCNLYFPAKWENQVSIEKIEEEQYIVQFFGNIEGEEQQHLFDVLFSGTEGIKIGDLTMVDGTVIPVYIYSVEQQMNENWTEEEKNIIYAMQEDINYTIEKIEELDNFQTIE